MVPSTFTDLVQCNRHAKRSRSRGSAAQGSCDRNTTCICIDAGVIAGDDIDTPAGGI